MRARRAPCAPAAKRPWDGRRGRLQSRCLAVYLGRCHPSVPGGDAGELDRASPTRAEVRTRRATRSIRCSRSSRRWCRSAPWRGASTCSRRSATPAAAALRGGDRRHRRQGRPRPASLAGATLRVLARRLDVRRRRRGLPAEQSPGRGAPAGWRSAGGGPAALPARLRSPRSSVSGLAHHHTLVFYAVPVGALDAAGTAVAAIRARPRSSPRLALTVGAGLACYLYLPLAARRATTLSWGDPTTLERLRRSRAPARLRNVSTRCPRRQGAARFRIRGRLAAWGGARHARDARGRRSASPCLPR